MLFVAPFPPPVHGQSLASVAIEEAFLRTGLNVDRVDVSGPLVRKIRMHLLAAVKALLKQQSIYLSVNSNAGMWLTSIVALAGQIRGSRIVLHHHAYSHLRSRQFRLSALVRASGRNAIHVVLGRRMAEDLAKVAPEVRQVFILNNAGLVPDTGAPNPFQLPTSPIVLGHLSNLSEEKGIAEVVRLAVAAYQAGSDIRLLIAGPAANDAQPHIDKARNELDRNFKYFGPIYGNEKISFFNSISYFVFPSRYKNEASPLVLLEALASGVPCLTIDQGCIADTVSGAEGLLVDVEDDFVQKACAHLKADGHKDQSVAARAKFETLRTDHHNQLAKLVALIRDEGRR